VHNADSTQLFDFVVKLNNLVRLECSNLVARFGDGWKFGGG